MIVYSTMVEAEEQLPCGDKGETASQSQSGHREWFFYTSDKLVNIMIPQDGH